MNEDFETLLLKAKEDVYTLLQGGNLSKVLGQGYDFSELRTYESTDDIRHISWINSAKLGEPYVKKMHEERELNVVVSLLVDGRMVIGEKQKTMSYILALLGYSALYSNNMFQSAFFEGNIYNASEASKNIEVLEKNLKELSRLNPLGLKLEYGSIQNTLLQSIEAKSLFFVVGDFLEEIDLSILAQKHEVYVIMLRERWEENPMVSPDAQLMNPLNNKVLSQTVSKKALTHYVQKLKEHDLKLYEHFNAHNIKYTKVYESSEVLQKLEQLFYN